ncbi:hypothetical protein SAMN04487983_1010142 [Streptomyces sp. yr375]|nr:hypothetical protein SAMN04487983_1010142 [Streptomyces sp. yr375]
MLLALAGVMATDTGTAVAAPPPGACTQWCNNPPAGVTQQNWNWAVEAADFWANHWADTTTSSWYGGRSYYRLDQWAGRGWPGQTFGNRWYAFLDCLRDTTPTVAPPNPPATAPHRPRRSSSGRPVTSSPTSRTTCWASSPSSSPTPPTRAATHHDCCSSSTTPRPAWPTCPTA